MESINHYNAVRLRVTGSGSLQMFLRSFDNTISETLTSLTMAATTNREPTQLANFIDQRAQLELKTTEINETFTVSKIIVFLKPFATEFPG